MMVYNVVVVQNGIVNSNATKVFSSDLKARLYLDKVLKEYDWLENNNDIVFITSKI